MMVAPIDNPNTNDLRRSSDITPDTKIRVKPTLWKVSPRGPEITGNTNAQKNTENTRIELQMIFDCETTFFIIG
jgi:hypothetical protein